MATCDIVNICTCFGGGTGGMIRVLVDIPFDAPTPVEVADGLEALASSENAF